MLRIQASCFSVIALLGLPGLLLAQVDGPVKKLPHESAVMTLAFSPKGEILAVGTSQGMIYLWDPATGKEIGRLAGHTQAVLSLAFSPDGKILASGSQDYTTRLWNVAERKQTRLVREPQAVYCVTFSPDGQILASSGWFYEFHLWAGDGSRLVRTVGIPDMALTLAFASDGKTLYGGIREGRAAGRLVRAWDVASGKETAALPGHARNITCVQLSQDGRLLLSAGEDGKIGVWDVVTAQHLRWLDGHKQNVESVAFSPNARLAASCGADKSVRIWDVATGKEIRRFDGHLDSVRRVAFSPQAALLASGSLDKTVVLLDLAGLMKPGAKEISFAAADLEALWNDLASLQAFQAAQAVWTLTAAPKQAVPFLKKKLPPATFSTAEQKRVAQWIGHLDDEEFAVRQQATEELARLGKVAESALQHALQKPPSLEARRRMESLLGKLSNLAPSPERLRAIRVVTVLDWIGTPEARTVLEGLAQGAAGTWETIEAQAALKRVKN